MPSAPVSTMQRASASRTVCAMPSRIPWSSALRLAGLEIVRRRTPSAGVSVRRRPLLKDDEGIALVDGLSLLAEDLLHGALVLGLDGHLHLHRLEDHDGVAFGDLVADLAFDLPHGARDVGLDVRHALPPGKGLGTRAGTIAAPMDVPAVVVIVAAHNE